MNKKRYRKFFSYYKPYKKILIIDLVCAAVVAMCAIAFPLLVRYITNDILVNSSTNKVTTIISVGFLMVVLAVVWYGAMFYVGYYGHVMGVSIESDLRTELFAKYQGLSFGFYDKHKTGKLMSILTNDLLDLTELYHHGPEDVFIYSVRFIGGLIVLSTINLKLTIVLVACLPVLLIYAYQASKSMRRALRTNKKRIADINSVVEDNLAGIRVVKSFANEKLEKEKFLIENKRFFFSRKKAYLSETLFDEGLGFLAQLWNIIIIIFAAVAIATGRMNVADLLTFMLYISFFFEPISKISHLSSQWNGGLASFERFMDIIETEVDIKEKDGAINLSEVIGKIEYKDVNFGYDDTQLVLKDINFCVEPGEMVAVIGVSGVGKSTLCSLLPRFYDVKSGKILIDDCELRDITIDSLRKNIGVVQQDVYLFDGTVYDNIAYGNEDASREDVVEAAKKANAHDFIIGLSAGYDTYVGQRGVKLSGGQKQRISIARTFLKDPKILIFDEATSSLDNESERIIHEALGSLSASRTTFVIAHRLSTIKNAKRIIVLDNKTIVEQGNHDELLQLNGVYAKLYHIQSRI